MAESIVPRITLDVIGDEIEETANTEFSQLQIPYPSFTCVSTIAGSCHEADHVDGDELVTRFDSPIGLSLIPPSQCHGGEFKAGNDHLLVTEVRFFTFLITSSTGATCTRCSPLAPAATHACTCLNPDVTCLHHHTNRTLNWFASCCLQCYCLSLCCWQTQTGNNVVRHVKVGRKAEVNVMVSTVVGTAGNSMGDSSTTLSCSKLAFPSDVALYTPQVSTSTGSGHGSYGGSQIVVTDSLNHAVKICYLDSGRVKVLMRRKGGVGDSLSQV